MIFNKEADFEEALIKVLSEKGWEKNILKNYSEEDLLRNWADILFENNRDIDRLNDYPLTNGEMQQILEQIVTLKTPVKLNGFINGKSVTVEGRNYDFDIALQTQSEKDFIRVSGKASGNTSVSDNSNTIEIKSDTYINAANVKSYEFDNISENNVENTVNNIMIDDESGEIVNSKKLSYTFGDINNDGVINSKDRMTLTRYIAKWNGIKIINDQASDVNYDGKVNAKDRMILTRHLAKWQEYEILPNNK